MLALIVRRLLQLPIVLLVIYTVTLTLAWAIPGNPLDNDEGRRPPAAVVERMQQQYNLDSFPKFYFSYLASATGWKYAADRLDGTIARDRQQAAELGIAPRPRRVFDLGPSLYYEDWSVNEIIGSSLPVSATLGVFAILIATGVGVAAGVIGAIRPNSLADLTTLAIALVGISLPSFVTGTVLLLLFSVWIPIFPVAGWGTLDRLVQPSIALSLPFAAYIARLTRMGMIETLSADYIRTARAKGLSERKVIFKHALKNAFLPVLSFLGPATALAMTGSFIVERVFSIPGLGEHFVNAVQTKDLFLIVGVVLVFATMLIVFNLVVDLLYRWVDPRIEQ
ncbi:MAG: ABC transporter permease [Phycisphaerales bacterium]|nr:ABC transporter permease [Phycisphaerales bacterium]